MAARKVGETAVTGASADAVAEVAASAAAATLAAAQPVPATPAALPAPDAPRATKASGTEAASAASRFNTATTEVKANMDKAMKTAEELVSFGQGNFEALVKSGQIWATGMQDLGKQVAATAQAQMDQTMATLKALAAVKSFKEAVELQSSLARSSVEKAVTETGKLTDASMKLAEQTMAPITARVSLAVERFGRAV